MILSRNIRGELSALGRNEAMKLILAKSATRTTQKPVTTFEEIQSRFRQQKMQRFFQRVSR